MDVQLPSLTFLLDESGISPDALIDALYRHLEDVQEVAIDYPPYDFPLEFLEVERYKKVINEFLVIVFENGPGRTPKPASQG